MVPTRINLLSTGHILAKERKEEFVATVVCTRAPEDPATRDTAPSDAPKLAFLRTICIDPRSSWAGLFSPDDIASRGRSKDRKDGLFGHGIIVVVSAKTSRQLLP